jgi:hypothetical protein
MTDGKWTRAFLTDKIYGEGDDVWAAAGSKYIADLYNDRFSRWMMRYLKWTFQWNCTISNVNTFSGVSRETEIIHVNKKYAYLLMAVSRQFSLRLFNFRVDVLNVTVSKTRYLRKDLEWMIIGSGHEIANRYMNRGYNPDVAIRLTAMEDMHTNSLIQTVKCK